LKKGCSIDTVFSEFEEQAFASASIGQVHRAKLRENNQDVVVKVQHPEVEKTLPQDMLTLAQMSWALGVVEKGFNVFPILEEWQKSAADELDFRIELSHQQRASKAVKVMLL
jgi:predicted unusual protein kinase regulating ubiquinone biosynthesis (AarF/ABC1/UbiB family)